MPEQTPFDPPRPPLPDPRRAHQALRDVRNAMRAGFGFVRHTIDRAPLPTPVAAVAGSVLREVDHLAHQADATASTLVHGFLAAAGIDVDDRAPRRAAALSAALLGVLSELDANGLLVSEAGVRAALSAGSDDTGDASARAAALMQRLLAAKAVRAAARPPRDGAVDPAVPVFAAVLADLQEVSSDRAGLAASAALADALAGEIAAAGSDRAALARLFAEFRAHV